MEHRPVYEGIDVAGSLPEGVELAHADVIGGRFVGLSMTEASLRGAQFTDCRFEDCEMTLVDVTDVTMHDVTFEACRLQAVNFATLARDPVGVSARFERCDLNLAVFQELDGRLLAFDGGTAVEATFVDADLRGSSGFVFSPCDNRVRGLRIDLGDAVGLLSGAGVRWD